MEHAKKYVLITPETLQRLRENSVNDDSVTTQLDKDMKKVLNSNISDHEKWALYQENLQRYLHFQKQLREPVKVPLINTDDTYIKLEKEAQLSDDEILNTLPQTFRRKADLFLNKLKLNKNITWDKNGLVSINNSIIQNSNIIDLVGDLMRPRKTPHPAGWHEFSKELKKTNVPTELIGNPRRRIEFMRSTPPSLTSVRQNTQRTTGAEYDLSPILWESFNFKK